MVLDILVLAWKLFATVIGLCLIIPVTNGAEDERCRCVCPRLEWTVDGVDYTHGGVFIKKQVTPEQCRCETIIPPKALVSIQDIEKFCLRCECKYEQRNSTTQKVVIIIVIVVFGLMFIYALFLMCLDPIMNKRRTHYTQQIDSVAQEIPADQPGASGSQASRRVTAAVKRVRAEQEKWKGQVDEQRHNIYTKHKILA